MTDRELMQQAMGALLHACGNRCNTENNPCWPREVAEEIRARLAQPEPEPVDKESSPCPEFWDWLPKAYLDGEKSAEPRFTKYNMEVAYLAGKQSVVFENPVAWMGTDAEGNPNKFRLNQFGSGVPLYTAPPQREWQGLTDEEFNKAVDGLEDLADCWMAIEAKLKEKNI